MPHRHYPPAYLRYLKARLLNLGKPSFWGTAIFLSVLGLVIQEYWSNPNVFTDQPNQEFTSVQPNNSLSAEDKAIAADIDNLPALFNDFDQVSLPIPPSNPKEKSQANQSNNLLQEISKQQSANSTASNAVPGMVNNTPAPQPRNPFVLEAENLLRLGTFDSGNQSLGIRSLPVSSEPTVTAATSAISGIGSNQTENSPNTYSISPLRTPLNQPTNQALSGINGETSTQINSLGQTSVGGVMQTPGTNSSPNQAFSSSTGLNTGTGYIQPTVPNNLPPNSYNNFNSSPTLPSQVPPTTVTSPVNVTSGVQTNIAPYAIQPPSPDIVAPTTPVVADRNGNLIWQQPTQQPQSNFSVPGQTPGQDQGRIQIDSTNFRF
ncbi:MAG: hypothetical protein AB3A66_15680 [Nodularia sp. CChRGM 3473]